MGIIRKKRLIVYERDNNKCIQCGSTDNLTIDHIIPLVKGGSNNIKNLQTLCWSCNHKKGKDHSISTWQRIKNIWSTHEDFTELKNWLLHITAAEAGTNKKRIEVAKNTISQTVNSQVDKKLSESESRTKKIADDFSLIANGLNNVTKIQAQRIKELEDTILLLADYLEIECVPSKTTKPYFRKKHEKQ